MNINRNIYKKEQIRLVIITVKLSIKKLIELKNKEVGKEEEEEEE